MHFPPKERKEYLQLQGGSRKEKKSQPPLINNVQLLHSSSSSLSSSSSSSQGPVLIGHCDLHKPILLIIVLYCVLSRSRSAAWQMWHQLKTAHFLKPVLRCGWMPCYVSYTIYLFIYFLYSWKAMIGSHILLCTVAKKPHWSLSTRCVMHYAAVSSSVCSVWLLSYNQNM